MNDFLVWCTTTLMSEVIQCTKVENRVLCDYRHVTCTQQSVINLDSNLPTIAGFVLEAVENFRQRKTIKYSETSLELPQLRSYR